MRTFIRATRPTTRPDRELRDAFDTSTDLGELGGILVGMGDTGWRRSGVVRPSAGHAGTEWIARDRGGDPRWVVDFSQPSRLPRVGNERRQQPKM